MAKWKVKPNANTGTHGTFEYDGMSGESIWSFTQDERPFLEQAKMERELQSKRDVGYKKFATIPEIVAIDIKEKWGIDIHAPDTVGDKNKMAKFMQIVKENYADLLSY